MTVQKLLNVPRLLSSFTQNPPKRPSAPASISLAPLLGVAMTTENTGKIRSLRAQIYITLVRGPGTRRNQTMEEIEIE